MDIPVEDAQIMEGRMQISPFHRISLLVTVAAPGAAQLKGQGRVLRF
jgi:hypothetical protein